MLVENLSDGIVIFDAKGESVLVNRAARETQVRMSGTSERAANWREYYELCYPDGKTPIPKDQLPRYRALRGETVRNFEMIAVAPHRTPVVLLVTSQPLMDPSGLRSGGIDVVRDITEERKADLLKSEFVSVVSHELRTPLTSIFGSLSLVRGGAAGNVSEKAAKLIEIAFRNAERLTLLINDILDIEKIESGELRLRLQPQALQPLVQQALESNAGYAQGCEVKLVLTRPVPDVQVSVDENRLLQVLANLLSNASKFSQAGSTVDITVNADDQTVRIAIEDHGPGIAPEFQSRIFQKFSQADGSDTRAKAGTGLGLAISRALIERMSGKIGYTTQVGVGSVFYIDLPVVRRDITSCSPDRLDPSCATAQAR
jgi:signal transduction histidine kinase